MTEYQLKINGEIKASGAFMDCWRSLVNTYGDKTLASLSAFGISIAPKY